MATEAIERTAAANRPERLPGNEKPPEIGDWFWVAPSGSAKEPWLACVVHVGSNFAKLEGVGPRGFTQRVHVNEWAEVCTPEPDADRIIGEHVERHRLEAQRLMGEVKTLTGRLAVTHGALAASAPSESSTLALRGAGQPIEEYKHALVLAKQETLPALFKAIEAENAEMGSWMSARLIPLKAQAEGMMPAIKAIENRIFSVELYAGLVEHVEQIAGGDPAPLATPVHLMQRRAYMDEECLARYRTGGMAFRDLAAFDRWIAEPQNRDRILPFPRCIIAFQIRRHERDVDHPSLYRYIQMMEERELDKLTFLYIRNGERLYRLSTGIEFGAKLFPDLSQVDLGGQLLYAKIRYREIEELITEGEYEERLAAEKAARKREREAPPGEQWRYRVWERNKDEFKRFSPESVYYDDISAYVQGEMERHNRLVLVLQGLFDRSSAFHPHPPWQLWTLDGFEQALRLVYDQGRALSAGEAPDFEAYRARLNGSLGVGSVTVGQQDAWEEAMAERENRRLDNDWRSRGDYRHKRFKPYGDPGPGVLAEVRRWRRTDKATYEWERERLKEKTWRSRHAPDSIRSTFTADAARLLNVSAYKPGDFRQFFDDPRTRADYLKWAPLLLEAEEYVNGNRKLGESEE